MDKMDTDNRETRAEMKAYHERMMAKMDSWLGKTEAC
jgi:hypothetical protein